MAFQKVTFAEALSTPGVIFIPNDIAETLDELNTCATLQFVSGKAYAVGDVQRFMRKHSILTLDVIYTDTIEKAEHVEKH